jgi:RNA-directed DNA polymerase
VKPTNKAEQSAAEPVEPRTGTEGNAEQQRTRRAQDRESVSQALDRVRLAARRGKQERFTSLLHHINPENKKVTPRLPSRTRQTLPLCSALPVQAHER